MRQVDIRNTAEDLLGLEVREGFSQHSTIPSTTSTTRPPISASSSSRSGPTSPFSDIELLVVEAESSGGVVASLADQPPFTLLVPFSNHQTSHLPTNRLPIHSMPAATAATEKEESLTSEGGDKATANEEESGMDAEFLNTAQQLPLCEEDVESHEEALGLSIPQCESPLVTSEDQANGEAAAESDRDVSERGSTERAGSALEGNGSGIIIASSNSNTITSNGMGSSLEERSRSALCTEQFAALEMSEAVPEEAQMITISPNVPAIVPCALAVSAKTSHSKACTGPAISTTRAPHSNKQAHSKGTVATEDNKKARSPITPGHSAKLIKRIQNKKVPTSSKEEEEKNIRNSMRLEMHDINIMSTKQQDIQEVKQELKRQLKELKPKKGYYFLCLLCYIYFIPN